MPRSKYRYPRSFKWHLTPNPRWCFGGDKNKRCPAKPIKGVTLCVLHARDAFKLLSGTFPDVKHQYEIHLLHIEGLRNALTGEGVGVGTPKDIDDVEIALEIIKQEGETEVRELSPAVQEDVELIKKDRKAAPISASDYTPTKQIRRRGWNQPQYGIVGLNTQMEKQDRAAAQGQDYVGVHRELLRAAVETDESFKARYDKFKQEHGLGDKRDVDPGSDNTPVSGPE